jgi:hypothetical protein
MTETNPPHPSPQADPAGQLELIRLSTLQHEALMAALEAFRAEMRAEFAMLRIRIRERPA